MKASSIYEVIEKHFPLSLCEPYDNSGENIVTKNKEILKILVCLDVTSESIKNAKKENIDLIISHHPLIFKSIKNINYVKNSLLMEALKSNMNFYSCHTNFDAANDGMNFILAKKLKLKNIKNLENSNFIGKIGELKEVMNYETFLNFLSEKLENPYLRYINESNVKEIAILAGSGGEFIEKFYNITYITGDIKHHEWLKAKELGIFLIDVGHFESEILFTDFFYEFLKSNFEEIEIIKYNENSPIKYHKQGFF